ncbi:sigma-70 family RNA polymerase sigma factor [Streptomyces sp. NBC_01298]|uniref:RNA polymerase sigma factor n=1 Tax=Streptomyces sp. NBC_01298 TaxID=2903817 RepID=UPI002E158A23|nr:sigma-70 family RNA polymerase sigma factor [Streptomyces sp. NBC_01298]
MSTTTDEEHFTAIYQRHYANIESYIRRRCEPAQVSDLVAEVFMAAWRRLGDIPPTSTLPWLYGVARNILANSYRAQERQTRLLAELAGQREEGVSDHAETVQNRLLMAAAFDRLSPDDQEVLRLSLWEDLSARDAAKIMGCSTAAYHVRLHRARKRLQKGTAVEQRTGVSSGATGYVPARTEGIRISE